MCKRDITWLMAEKHMVSKTAACCVLARRRCKQLMLGNTAQTLVLHAPDALLHFWFSKALQTEVRLLSAMQCNANKHEGKQYQTGLPESFQTMCG